MSSANRNRRRGLIPALVVGALAFVVLSGTLPRILNPPVGDRSAGDVVFVHVGGEGERWLEAVEAMNEGPARTLVIPTDPANEWVEEDLCGQTEPFEVVCLDYRPDRTAEEARAFADLVRDRDWRSATVITTDYHMARALMIDQSCVGIDLRPVPVDSPLRGIPLAVKIGHEVIGLPYSWLFDRC